MNGTVPLDVLVVTGGHPFDHNGFHAIFDESPAVNATVVEQPAAEIILRPEFVSDYDAVLFYDQSGVIWDLETGGEAQFPDPPQHTVDIIEALLESGKGLVLVNHAIVSWPSWPLWREITGTSFMLLAEGELNGETVPCSGYRGGIIEPERNVTHRMTAEDPSHPVCAGLEAGFEITDELYLKTPGFENHPDILPLFRSDYDFSPRNFNRVPLVALADEQSWDHPQGSNLIAWAKRTGNSPVVASEAGDTPMAFANLSFRKFLENALKWVASDEAKAWACDS